MATQRKTEPAPLAYFDPGDGRRIAYRLRAAKPEVKGPTLMFLPGYASDMEGDKASGIDAFAAAAGLAYLRFDYSGTGSSGGDFAEGTLDRWLDEVVSAIDLLTEGPVLLIGSSMGGWLALLAAQKRPDRVKAVVGIAAAPDFTEDSMWSGFSEAERRALQRDGRVALPSAYSDEPYVITRRLIEEGRANLVLRAPLRLGCPVRLLQGTADEDVDRSVALRLLDHIEGPDVRLTLVKGADHRFSGPSELALIGRTLDALAEGD